MVVSKLKKLMVLSVLFCGFSYEGLECWCQVLFRPRDNIRARLLEMIKQERVSIDSAVYMLTDKTIADALVEAYVRGVKVRVVLDQISMGEKYGKGLYLQRNGIQLFIHVALSSKAFFIPLMHHKFLIFGYNEKTRGSLVWTGSYNFTAAASTIHDENVLITDDLQVVKEYQSCFDMLVNKLEHRRVYCDWLWN